MQAGQEEHYPGHHSIAARLETQPSCWHGYKACERCYNQQKPHGWYFVQGDGVPDKMVHHPTGAIVWSHWANEAIGEVFCWAPPGYSACNISDGKPTLLQAMAAALGDEE